MGRRRAEESGGERREVWRRRRMGEGGGKWRALRRSQAFSSDAEALLMNAHDRCR